MSGLRGYMDFFTATTWILEVMVKLSTDLENWIVFRSYIFLAFYFIFTLFLFPTPKQAFKSQILKTSFSHDHF